MPYKTASLTPEQSHILLEQGTEAPNSGCYNLSEGRGSYLCRNCGKALFRSEHKFISACGWPSFDDEIDDAIKRLPDPDGRRTEIRCQRCDGHLGHVFHGEGHTDRNLRHCVNSLSVDFVTDESVLDTAELIVAGGCFWGIQHFLEQEPGVLFTEVGYTGGTADKPSYQALCQGSTGHYEAVRIIFDTAKTDAHKVLTAFFEIHDPTQADGQAGDIGQQYQSAVFYYDEQQKQIIEERIATLKAKGFDAVTRTLPVSVFWPAEEEHQDYLMKNPGGYCAHRRVKRF